MFQVSEASCFWFQGYDERDLKIVLMDRKKHGISEATFFYRDLLKP